ncbi:MAG: hypothetical protein Q8P50_04590 [Bacillota bacterium]|nr:hypothetical protein [Bacillota bacterium]
MSEANGNVIKAILVHPLSLLILGGSLLAAWMFDFWHILLLGLAVEVWLAFTWLSSEKFREEVRAQVIYMKLKDLDDKAIRAIRSVWERSWGVRQQDSRIARLHKGKEGILQAYRSSSSGSRVLMGDMVELALKSAISYVELYKACRSLMQTSSQATLKESLRELDGLQARAARTSDARAREEYKKAMQFKEEEVQAYGRTLAQIEALVARMDKIEAALSGIRSKMAAVSTFELKDYDREVELLRNEATSLESAVSEMTSTK